MFICAQYLSWYDNTEQIPKQDIKTSNAYENPILNEISAYI